MKKFFKLTLTLTLFLFLTGTASAIPVAKFGKYLSDDNIDIWLLSLLCDSDLSITLTSDDAISFLFHDNGSGTKWKGVISGGGNNGDSYTGRVAKGNYFIQVKHDGKSVPDFQDPLGDGPYGNLPTEGDGFTDEGQTGTLIDIAVSPVPEPATMFLLGLGLLFIGRTARKFRS